MRIAILGTRGVPAAYGGFETLAEELSARLAALGHDVTVYARRGRVREELQSFRGAKVVYVPTLNQKYLETVVHGILSGLHAAAARYDAVLVCNGINALACRLPRALGSPTRIVLNVDGLERKRRKWNAAGRLAYALSERLSCVLPDVLVTDARAIQRYYAEVHGTSSTYVPYGSDLPEPEDLGALSGLGLSPHGYVLYVSRFEPENNPEAVVEGYRGFGGKLPLVLLGSAPYSDALIGRIRAEAARDARVLLPGALYGEGYRALLANAAAYVHATEVGGTHPALIEAMGFARPVVVHDTPENREAAGDAALYWNARRPETLGAALTSLFASAGRRREMGEAARRRAEALYLWDDVTRAYEAVLTGRTKP